MDSQQQQQQQRLHTRFTDPSEPPHHAPPGSSATYPPATAAPLPAGSFDPFSSVIPSVHPPTSSQSLPAPSAALATPPLYDSPGGLRGPWTPTESDVQTASPALLRSISNPHTRNVSDSQSTPDRVSSQLGLVDDSSDVDAGGITEPSDHPRDPNQPQPPPPPPAQDDDAAAREAAEEEMRRQRRGAHNNNDNPVPPRRQQRLQQPPPSAFPGAMGGMANMGVGGGFGMPGVFAQAPEARQTTPTQQTGPYPRGYSPGSYPSPMQVMLGQHPYPTVPVPPIGVYQPPVHSYDPAAQGMMGMTSPVQFGPPQPYVGMGGFQRISPDPMPAYTSPPRAPGQGQGRGGYAGPYGAPQHQGYPGSPGGSHSPPLPVGMQQGGMMAGRMGMQGQQGQGQTAFPSLYSPSPPGAPQYTSPTGQYHHPSSPVFQPVTHPQHRAYQPYTPAAPYTSPTVPYTSHPTSPEESMRGVQGGTWIYVPDPGVQGGYEGGYGGTYGLGFGGAGGGAGVGRGDEYTGSSTSPSSAGMFSAPVTGPNVGGYRVAPGSSRRPSMEQQPSQQHAEVDLPKPSTSAAPSATSPAGPSTSPDAPAQAYRPPSQTSQIPFPSLSSPPQPSAQSRHQRRASSPGSSARKPYHPNPPANRSEWVMWVGNVPPDATHDELWRFFNQPVPPRSFVGSPQQQQSPEDLSSGGVSSVFLISRSNCAFVNFNSEQALERAVAFFNGRPIRPADPRCPRLVCRVRRRDDDLRAGVGGQRGVGVHTRWVRDQQRTEEAGKEGETKEGGAKEGKEGKEVGKETGKEAAGGEEEEQSPTTQKTLGHSGSSGSFASTNSSFLTKYFPKRYFILKSLTVFDLNLSVERGIWATQAHNEPILDQAFRTSQDVYLIFGANKSGEFYGYARMAGPIASVPAQKTENRVSWASRTESSHSSSRSIESPIVKRAAQPEVIAEDEEGENRAQQPEADSQPEPAPHPDPEVETQQTHPPEINVADPSPPHEQEEGDEAAEVQHPYPHQHSALLSPGEGPSSVAASPQPMTQEESRSLEAIEGDTERRPVHHPHIRRSRQQSPVQVASLPTPSVPSGDDAPRPPAPVNVASAPAELGPERKRFTFDHVEPSHTFDSSDLHSASLAAVLASQPEFELSLPQTATERQANRGASSGETETDGDGIKRRDTALTQEEKEERSGSSGDQQPPFDTTQQAEQPTQSPPEHEPVQENPAESSAAAAAPSRFPPAERPPGGEPGEETTWGTPFRVEWIRVESLPFYRTRHLRNPWNQDREVKVSRDGTEIEPTVGARLLEEWDRLQEDPTPTPGPSRRGSRPPFRTGYSTPAQLQLGTGASGSIAPGLQPPMSPYQARDPASGVPQWLYTRQSTWQQ